MPESITSEGLTPEARRFFLPGPTAVRSEVLAAQTGPMIGHRSTAMESLMEELQVGLKVVFQTDRSVYVSTSSATGLMEAGVRNGTEGRVLSLVNGAFSERFARIAEACGRSVDRYGVAWGDVHDPEAVAHRVADGGYDAVTVVHSETSTGALNPIAEIGAAVGEVEGTLLLLDSVSGAAGAPLRTDDWGLDFVLAGGQKALAIPPGLSFAVASPALLERAAGLPGRGLYFDLLQFEEKIARHHTPNTPAVSLMYGLRSQLRRVRHEGMEARWERHRRMAERTWRWVEELREERGVDFRVLAPEGGRSPTVTCVLVPEGWSVPSIVGRTRERGYVVAPGYGRLKSQSFRIGHMGEHTLDELEELLAVLEEVLTE